MMDCMCCSSDDRWVEAKFDLMVERLRSWIDDVEYKIKDAIENRKSMFCHVFNAVVLQNVIT